MAAAKKRFGRLQLFSLHSWLGFHLAALTGIVLLTGTLAVVADEIEWLLIPEMRVTPQDQRSSWNEMEAAVRQHAPNDALFFLRPGEGDRSAYQALMVDESGKSYFLLVNQWTGEVTGELSSPRLQVLLREMHRYLFMPKILGQPIVSSVAIVLLISLFTGLKTIGHWRSAATRLRTGQNARVFIGDLHKVTALWGSGFLLLMAITGLWYFAEFGVELTGGSLEPPRPAVSSTRLENFDPVIHDADADALIAAAKNAFPGFEPREVHFSIANNLPATVLGRYQDFLVRNRANRVFIDPVSAAPIEVQRSEAIGLTTYLNEIADPIHFGTFAGLSSKLLWFVFGASLTSLAFTGVWLRWKRLKGEQAAYAQLGLLPVLFIVLTFGFQYFAKFLPPDELGQYCETPLLTTSDISAQLKLYSEGDCQLNGHVRALITAPAGRLTVQSVELRTQGASEASQNRRAGYQGRRTAVTLQLPIGALQNAEELVLLVTFISGEVLEYRWANGQWSSVSDSQ